MRPALSNSQRRVLMLFVTAMLIYVSEASFGTRDSNELRRADRIRISEARQICGQLAERIWSGWQTAPKAVLLVTDNTEFLVYHDHPSDDFTLVGYDDLLRSNVYKRDRVFNKGLLATFPAVNGVPTVVIGKPENTASSHSTRWVATLIHEHFHQWQMSQPDYYSALDALDLSGGDTTGMWMLNYPFPYESDELSEAFSEMCRRLRDVLDDNVAGSFQEKFANYILAKKVVRDLLDNSAYDYLAFQVWQEGISRYAEHRMAVMASLLYQPTKNFQSLPDYIPFGEVAEEIHEHVMTELGNIDLGKQKRAVFYYIGAAEGMLLDRINPNWRFHYMEEKFSIDGLFES